MNKLLTIVIPTYNMQDYLRRCLDSLLVSDEQLQQLEVLVINDGSKDNSSAIAHEYETKYPNTFRVIDKENGNYGSCINRGLAEAIGKYIKVLDADDWFDTDNFSDFLTFLSGTDTDMVLSDFDQLSGKGVVLNPAHYGMDSDRIYSIRDIPRKKLFLMHAVTYKRSIFDGLNYHQTEGISYTDQEWIFLPLTRVNTFRYFPKVVYKYLIGREGQTMDPNIYNTNISHTIRCANTIMGEYEQHYDQVDEAHREFMDWRLTSRLQLIYHHLLIKDLSPAGLEALKEFDKNMQINYPRAYEFGNRLIISKRIPYRYISDYRRAYSAQTIGLVLYRLYLSIRSKIG